MARQATQLQYFDLASYLWLAIYGFLHRRTLRPTHVTKKNLLNIIPFIIKQPCPFFLHTSLFAAVVGFCGITAFELTVCKAVFITGIILSISFFVATLFLMTTPPLRGCDTSFQSVFCHWQKYISTIFLNLFLFCGEIENKIPLTGGIF